MTAPKLPALDLLKIVAEVLAGVDAPLSIQDNSYPRSFPTDPIGMVCASAPAYRVLVVVNGPMLPGGPWVSVTHTERFGMTPIGLLRNSLCRSAPVARGPEPGLPPQWIYVYPTDPG